MKRMFTFSFVLAGLLALAGCGKSTRSPAAQGGKLKIAVIPKGSTDVYWQYIHAGALAAGRKLGVHIIFQGPIEDGDRMAEIQIMDNFINQHVNGIVLAPIDSHALVPPVRQAKAAHIPVVIIDSVLQGTPGKSFVSFVATNDFKAGERDGQYLARLLGGKGKVVMLNFLVGSGAAVDRARGFLAAMKQYPAIKIISRNQYGGSTPSRCEAAALNMMSRIRQANGIFCVNETTTFGMYLALKQVGLLGKKKFVGFDWQSNFKRPIEKGQINGVMVQDPFHMAYEGVKFLVEHIRGKKVPATLDTPAVIVTTKNIHTPAIKKLVKIPNV